jgi:hypothetical protein
VLKLNQQINSDHLNSAFISKKATGTQIMLGGLNILGTLYAGNVTLSGTLDAGSNTIKTTGTINAGTFSGSHSGSGASLTSLNASNISSGTLTDARLSSNVVLLNKAQTFTANNTYSTSANLYFAGGTTYYINTSGSAKFNTLNVTGNVTFDGNDKLMFSANGIAAPTDTSAGTKIQLYSNKYQIGVDSATVWYDSYTYHKFFTNSNGATRTERFRVSTSGIDVYGTATITKDLEVQGEAKFGGANEFPDPLLSSRSTNGWTATRGAIEFDSTQKPSGINATGSMKTTASDADMYVMQDYSFEVKPEEWITFSAYAYSTTASKSGQLWIAWYKADGTSTTGWGSSTHTIGTSWGRYSVTTQAPADAASFKVRVDNDGGVGTIIYFAGFQVERGRAMTAFKPFGGSAAATFTDKGIMLGYDGEIHSAYNNTYIIKDHKNGNVTLSAAGKTGGAYSDLYLGYQNTNAVRLHANLVGSNGTTKIADTGGKLYYQGTDTDSRYVNSAGDTMTGKLTIDADTFPQLHLKGGPNNHASILMTEDDTNHGARVRYDGSANEFQIIGLNSSVDTVGLSMHRGVGINDLKYKGNTVWHAGNDGSGTGLDADVLDGMQPSTGTGGNTIVQRNSSGYIHATYFNSSRSNETSAAASYLYDTGDGYIRKKTLANARDEIVTASDILSKMKTVDGSGSGLDADFLDGNDSDYYDQRIYNSKSNYLGAGYISGGNEKPNWFGSGKLKLQMLSSSNLGKSGGSWNDVLWLSSYTGGDVKGSYALIFDKYNDDIGFARQDFDAVSWGTYRKIWHSANMGSGSGLDADKLDGLDSTSFLLTTGKAADSDKLDGLDSSSFLRSNATDSASGNLTFTGTFNVKSGAIYTSTNGRLSVNQTSNTEHPLQVKAAGSSQGVNITANADTDVVGYSIENSTGNANWHIARSGVAAADLIFYGGNAADVAALTIAQNERVRFTNDGKVGIGWSDPLYKLDVNGVVMTQDLHISHPEAHASRMSISYTNTHQFDGTAWGYLIKDTLNNKDRIYIQQTANALAQIAMNGYLAVGGVGMPNTSYRLDVYGSAQVRGDLNLTGANIGMGNDTSVIEFVDSTNQADPHGGVYYSAKDALHFKGDGGDMDKMVIRSGNVRADTSMYAGTRVGVNKFAMEYNSSDDSLDFVYYG